MTKNDEISTIDLSQVVGGISMGSGMSGMLGTGRNIVIAHPGGARTVYSPSGQNITNLSASTRR